MIARRSNPAARTAAALAWCLAMAAAPGTTAETVAAAPPATGEHPTVVIIGDDGQQVTLTVVDDQLHIISREDGEVEVHTVDLNELGAMIEDAVTTAMRGVDRALEAVAEHLCADAPRQVRIKRRASTEESALRAEIAALQAEIAALRTDLQRLR